MILKNFTWHKRHLRKLKKRRTHPYNLKHNPQVIKSTTIKTPKPVPKPVVIPYKKPSMLSKFINKIKKW